MAALCNGAGHYIFALWFLQSSIFFYLFFLVLSQQSPSGCLPYFCTWRGLRANLECGSEMCCTRLAGNTRRKNDTKCRHLRTIEQVCGAISSQLRHIDNRKKIVKQQYILHMSSQYGEFRPTSGSDLLASLGHPSKFQRLCFQWGRSLCVQISRERSYPLPVY